MRRIASVGFTILGVWACIVGLQGGLSAAQFTLMAGEPGSGNLNVALAAIPGLVMVIIGASLIALRQRISAALFSDDSAEISVETASLLRVFLITAGIVWMVQSVSGLTYWATDLVSTSLNQQLLFGESIDTPPLFATIADLAVDVALLAFSIVLLVFSARISSWLLGLGAGETTAPPVNTTSSRDCCASCGEPYDPADYEPGALARCVRCGAELG